MQQKLTVCLLMVVCLEMKEHSDLFGKGRENILLASQIEMGGHDLLKKTKYRSIDEIPDELVMTYSKRDPDNMLYKTRRWVNFKKKQILFSQMDGVPNYLRTPLGRYTYYGLWTSSIGLFFFNIYKYNQVAK